MQKHKREKNLHFKGCGEIDNFAISFCSYISLIHEKH